MNEGEILVIIVWIGVGIMIALFLRSFFRDKRKNSGRPVGFPISKRNN